VSTSMVFVNNVLIPLFAMKDVQTVKKIIKTG